MWKGFLDIFFPQFCLACRKEGDLICKDCLSTIEISEFNFCPFCQKPKRVFGNGKCEIHQKMNLDGLFNPTSYKDLLVKKLITKLKYEPFLKTLSSPLAFLIISHFLLTENKLIAEAPESSFFIPVPLSPARKRWRGFNQSEEIARELSIFFNVPVSFNNLIKIKTTQPQIELKKEEREKNVQGAFELKNPQIIRGKRIFLIDDVFTTGSTMEECSKTLKQAGAHQVWGIVVARE